MSILGFFRRRPDDPGATVAGGMPRSPQWDSWVKKFLKGKRCIACGASDGLCGHHVVPFHLRPDLELSESNVVPLCSDRCHLVHGHLDDFRLDNPTVREDCAAHLAKREAAKLRAK